MDFKKNIIRNLLLLGLILYISCLIIGDVFNLELQNSWFAALALFLSITPVLIAGILYSNKIKLIKPKIFLVIRLLVSLFIYSYILVFIQVLLIPEKDMPPSVYAIAMGLLILFNIRNFNFKIRNFFTYHKGKYVKYKRQKKSKRK